MHSRRKIGLRDLKRVIEFKTFKLVLALTLSGAGLLITSYTYVRDPNSALRAILSSLGITFITSSTVSLLLEVYLRFDLVDFVSKRLISSLPKELSGNTGVDEFHFDRKEIDFRSTWANSDSILYIIGISANDILAPNNFPLIRDRLQSDSEFSARILLLNPWSLTSVLRARAGIYKTEYECVSGTFEVLRNISMFYSEMNALGIPHERFQLRLYDDIPSLSMIIDKRIAYVSPFMVVEKGGSSPYFIARSIDGRESLYELYLEHFDKVWDGAAEIGPETEFQEVFGLQKEIDDQRIRRHPHKYRDWVLAVSGSKKRSDSA